MIPIEVSVISQHNRAYSLSYQAQSGETAHEVLQALGLPMSTGLLGCHGRRIESSYCVQPGDRIECYAPIRVDPKEARRLRILKQTKGHS